ncbi:Eukaryotic/viral aspartic protease [Phytophthora megakarya]|uniref:Eukaryotic/viral aspartic protease n=1 Tax=Phytophthora megakarya TaxID=4795 RepID=A0A225WCH6_9STRA|nr:Eukaryotic/viral aspartic protease [Phytophthora megakarya]
MLNRGELVDASTQTKEDALVTTGMDVATQVSKSWLDRHECDPGEGSTQYDDGGDAHVDVPPDFPIKREKNQGNGTSLEVHPELDTPGFHPETASYTPLERLEMEYERCMRVSDEEMDLEPVPELSELHPGCDIDQADVGIPGDTSPDDETRMRAILKRNRKIFLGDGNAAPARARGVVCDPDLGDAKPIALRSRSIGRT